jgi:hypothetical protein
MAHNSYIGSDRLKSENQKDSRDCHELCKYRLNSDGRCKDAQCSRCEKVKLYVVSRSFGVVRCTAPIGFLYSSEAQMVAAHVSQMARMQATTRSHRRIPPPLVYQGGTKGPIPESEPRPGQGPNGDDIEWPMASSRREGGRKTKWLK